MLSPFGLLNLDHLVECDPGGIAVHSILETLDAILNLDLQNTGLLLMKLLGLLLGYRAD